MDTTNQAPLLLRVITLIGILGVGLSLLASLASLGFLGFGSAFLSVFLVIIIAGDVLALVAFFGLRRMKKWAFYLMGVSTLIVIIDLVAHYSQGSLVNAIFDVLFFVYLWSLRTRFT